MDNGVNSVFMGVGGSFDVLSGHIKRAPMWMQNANLEWLFRVANEPKRLFKRYFVGNATFIKRVVHEKRKAKNNILHISRTMDIGGAERIVYQLATDLKDEFDQVHVASTGGLWEEKLAENGIQHHRILDVDSKQPATVLKILASLSKIIKENEITLVHTHHRMAAFYIRLLQMRHPKLIHVYTAHNVFKDKLPLYKFALGKARTVAVSQAVQENILNDVRSKNSVVIYNGVKMKQSEHTVNEITQCDGIKIGCIARLSEQKGLPYLIQAMSLVTNPSVSLFLVGDGELKNDLINQTKELGLEERIHFWATEATW